MLVTHILGDCPGCGEKNCYGNVFIQGNRLLRGCGHCRYSVHVALPPLKKKILYLDQFFYSSAFRGKDLRFVGMADKIRDLASKQLLVVPFSSIHEDETHQWRGYDNYRKDDLMRFIEDSARGNQFNPSWDVERQQVVRAFRAFLDGQDPEFTIKRSDVFGRDVDKWDDYLRIKVGRYMGDVDRIRELKEGAIGGFVDIFPAWSKDRTTFDEDVALEMREAGQGYVKTYFEYAQRISSGDVMAMLDAPIMSSVFQYMLSSFKEDVLPELRLEKALRYLVSDHFKNVPYHWVSSRIYAAVKDQVKQGAYKNKGKALKKFHGFFFDVRHIATYAPYSDAFFLDQPMHALVTNPLVGIEGRYGTKIFSLNTMDDFTKWLGDLEANLTEEHKHALLEAYPKRT